jgi:hypothetical protein
MPVTSSFMYNYTYAMPWERMATFS